MLHFRDATLVRFDAGERTRCSQSRPELNWRVLSSRVRWDELFKGCCWLRNWRLLVIFVWCSSLLQGLAQTNSNNFIRGTHRQLNDNGAWSWFMDERAIVDHGRLLAGSVRSNGEFGDSSFPGWGNVELSIYDLNSQETNVVVLSPRFEQDDHDSPALFVLKDGRYLAAYTRHGQETRLHYRISTRVGDPTEWGPVQQFNSPGGGGQFRGDNVTYCNLFRLSEEADRTYLFYRGVGLDPNYLVSDDDGRSWRYGGHVFRGRGGYSPYVKYASDGRGTIHLIATEDHPRNFDNSLYHAYLHHGVMHHSDGTVIGPLSTSTNTSLHAWDLTRIYQGGPTNVAWMCDVELDGSNPVVLFTAQRDGAGLPMGSGGMDHRYHYARWDGRSWHTQEIAFAGTRLYPGEDDYTGLGAIDPQHPSNVYISTDADPTTGRPLISKANFRRHHELFRGLSTDQGRTWTWSSLTANSSTDNLRPIVPRWNDPRTAVVWMRGAYRVNRGEWTTKVMLSILSPNDWTP